MKREWVGWYFEVRIPNKNWEITMEFVFISFQIKYFDFNNFIKKKTNIFMETV